MHGFARWVSIVLHPMVTLMLAVIYASAPTLDRSHFGILVGATAASLLAIAVFVLVQLRRGAIGNIDVSRREERPRLYLVGIVSTLACAALFWALALPPRVIGGAVCSASLLFAGFLVNMRLKASLHVAYTVYSLGLVWGLLPVEGRAFGVALVALMAWSRLALRRHTLPETLAGAAIGSLAAVAFQTVA